MSDSSTQTDDGRQLFTWSWGAGRSPYDELADAIIASGAKLYNQNGKLVTLSKTGGATPVEPSHLRYIIAEHIATRHWQDGGICSFAFQARANSDREPNADVLRWLLKHGLVERAPKRVPQLKTPLPDKPPTYPRLIAAVADAAKFNGRHTEHARNHRHECGLCVAHKQALDAIAGELLPTLFGGEWVLDKGKGRQAWPSFEEWRLITPLYDHGAIFRQHGSKPQGWHNSVIVSQPYNHVFRNGMFYPHCATAAQKLARQCQVGTWVSPELSAYFPGQSLLVLLAGGLTQEHAPLFGFYAVPNPALLESCA